jgi:hypothetical protein
MQGDAVVKQTQVIVILIPMIVHIFVTHKIGIYFSKHLIAVGLAHAFDLIHSA